MAKDLHLCDAWSATPHSPQQGMVLTGRSRLGEPGAYQRASIHHRGGNRSKSNGRGIGDDREEGRPSPREMLPWGRITLETILRFGLVGFFPIEKDHFSKQQAKSGMPIYGSIFNRNLELISDFFLAD